MKSTAVWIDTKQAKFVVWDGRRISSHIMHSGTERKPRVEGEKSKKGRRGITGFDFESTQRARFVEEFKKYLRSVVRELAGSNYVYLLGPSDTKLKLEKEIKRDNRVSPAILSVESCDSMSDNQLTEKVIAFFRGRLERKPPAPRRRLPPQGVRTPYRP